MTGASFTSLKVEKDILPTVTSAVSTATAARGRTSESQNIGLNQNRPNLLGTTSGNSTVMNFMNGNSMTANSSTEKFSASLAVPPLATLGNFVASSSTAPVGAHARAAVMSNARP